MREKQLRVVNSIYFTQEKTIAREEGKTTVTFTMPDDNVTLQPVFADVSSLYKLDFSNVLGGTMPPGWRCTQENSEVHEYPNSYSAGARTMAGFSGHQGKAIYWRNDCAEYGRQTSYPLTLEPGSYKLTFAMAAWKGTPSYNVLVLSATGTAVATTATFTATPNANGSTSASVASAQDRELEFEITEKGKYVIKFADKTTGGGYHEFLLLECRVNQVLPDDVEGDVNGDGAVNVADISSIISVMAGDNEELRAAADVNGDGNVDVADISTVITIMAANARRL